jgi:antitoxin (DNA-binding transcriptional repressor) of toxin-antitoxin stability system
MSQVFNMHQAKSNLSKLVEMVESGERVLLARGGQVVAEIIPSKQTKRPLLGEFEPVLVTHADYLSDQDQDWESDMQRKDKLLMELMREIADEQSAA